MDNLNNIVHQLEGEKKTLELIVAAESYKYSDLIKEIQEKDTELIKLKQLSETNEVTLREWKSAFNKNLEKLENISFENLILKEKLKQVANGTELINNEDVISSHQLISIIKTFIQKQTRLGFEIPHKLKESMNDPLLFISYLLVEYTALTANNPQLELNCKLSAEKYEYLQDHYGIQAIELNNEHTINEIQKLQLENTRENVSENHQDIIQSKQAQIDHLKNSMLQLEVSKTQYAMENTGLALKVKQITPNYNKL